MASNCCLAGSEDATVPLFSSVFADVKPGTAVSVARLDVAGLGKLAPDVLVCDVDAANVDQLELLRQIRFVLPKCTIAVYTGDVTRKWGVACHLAGVNCVLAKSSSVHDLSRGLRSAIRNGCYTDPRFADNANGSKAIERLARRKSTSRGGHRHE